MNLACLQSGSPENLRIVTFRHQNDDVHEFSSAIFAKGDLCLCTSMLKWTTSHIFSRFLNIFKWSFVVRSLTSYQSDPGLIPGCPLIMPRPQVRALSPMSRPGGLEMSPPLGAIGDEGTWRVASGKQKPAETHGKSSCYG